MFGDFETADIIAYTCARVDNKCRQELRPRAGGLPGTIKSERDYVSCLLNGIRNELSTRFKCLAETIDQGTEMKNGVDGLILFQFENEVKVGWLEAKWPRVLQADYKWDSIHDERLKSHFSEQILKQHKRVDKLAIWEMFFNEAADGYQSPPYCAFGSSCVWHENAFDFMKKERVLFERWTTDKLKSILEHNCTSFYSIIYDIIGCRKGKRIKVRPSAKSIIIENPRDEKDILQVPLPEEMGSLTPNSRDERVSAFLRERGIDGYFYVNLNSDKSKK